jgi:hypothetical protein
LIVPYDCDGNVNVILELVKLFTTTGIAGPLTGAMLPVQPMILSLGTGDVGSRLAVNSIAFSVIGEPEAEPFGRVEFGGSWNVMFVDV